MHRTPPFPFLPDLEMPLRDAMRGVANFAEATEEALEPAAKLLPEPLRDGFHKAIKSIETKGRQLADRPIRHEQIMSAADFAAGQTQGSAAAKDFATVICFGWDYLQDTAKAPRHLISETILLNKVSLVPKRAGSGAAFAAALVETIRKSSAIGRLPGISDGLRADEKSDIDMALVAIMVWLISARGTSVADEATLLELAFALISAIRKDVNAAMGDPAKVADILQNTSAHL